MRSSLTEAARSGADSGQSSRENSIEITAEETLNRLRALDTKPTHVKGKSRAKTTGSHMDRMSQSMNHLNLDRHSMLVAPTYRTVGGDDPREALMKLRIKRLSKKVTPTTSTERLYQSDSALFGGGKQNIAPSKANARDAVWFKSSYPTRQTLEKLDEAEEQFDDSSHRSGGDEDMPELDDFGTSCTDLWLHGNQSAPGDFQRRPTAAYLHDDDDEDETDDHVDDDMIGSSGKPDRSRRSKGNHEMVDDSIQIV